MTGLQGDGAKARYMVVCVFDESMWVEVEECLASCGVKRYTRAPAVLGVGERGGPRQDSAIWPGVNSCLFSIVDDHHKASLLEGIKALRARRETAAVHAYVLPVLEAV